METFRHNTTKDEGRNRSIFHFGHGLRLKRMNPKVFLIIPILTLSACGKPQLTKDDLARTLEPQLGQVSSALAELNKGLKLPPQEAVVMAQLSHSYLPLSAPVPKAMVSDGTTAFMGNATQGTWCPRFGAAPREICLEYVSRVFSSQSEARDLFSAQGVYLPDTEKDGGKPFRGKSVGYYSKGVVAGHSFWRLVVVSESQGLAITWWAPTSRAKEFEPLALSSFASLHFPP